MTFEEHLKILAKQFFRAMKEKKIDEMIYFSVRYGEVVTDAQHDVTAIQRTPKVIQPAITILKEHLSLDSFSDPEVLSMFSDLYASFNELSCNDPENFLYDAGISTYKLLGTAIGPFDKHDIELPKLNDSKIKDYKEKINFFDQFTQNRQAFQSVVTSLENSVGHFTRDDQERVMFTTAALRDYSDIYHCSMLKQSKTADDNITTPGKIFRENCTKMLDKANEHLEKYPEWKKAARQVTGIIVTIASSGFSLLSKNFRDSFFSPIKVKKDAIEAVQRKIAALA